MRELEECKAEIFRRSEQRIERRRKQQKGVVVGMLLFCLVFAAKDGNVFWKILPHANSEDMSVENEIQDNCAESIFTSFEKMEIHGASQTNLDMYQEITDKDDIMTVNGMILDLYATENPSADVSVDIEENTEQMEQDDSDSSLEYVIIFTTITGTQEIYTWKGNTLLEHDENRMVFLTDEQCSILSDLFNVIQE